MAIHNPSQYRYSLFDQWDKEAFDLIKKIAKTKNYPRITGNKDEKNQFFITLIRTQKSLHDWRGFLVAILDQIKKNNTIDTALIIKQFPPNSISKETPAWVTYDEKF